VRREDRGPVRVGETDAQNHGTDAGKQIVDIPGKIAPAERSVTVKDLLENLRAGACLNFSGAYLIEEPGGPTDRPLSSALRPEDDGPYHYIIRPACRTGGAQRRNNPPPGILTVSMPILDVNEIRQILPHRYPFLLVDRILELEPERIVGIKNVTVNEPFFNGHFPEFPVMPGVLIVEAMAQTAGVLVLKSIPERDSKLVLLVSIDAARFRRPVVPGDQLRIEMTVLRRKGSVAKMAGRATVDGLLVAEAEVMCKLEDKVRPPVAG
jgi:3-hydroxyacyl-[acyl-carrier-protein] dehydratase